MKIVRKIGSETEKGKNFGTKLKDQNKPSFMMSMKTEFALRKLTQFYGLILHHCRESTELQSSQKITPKIKEKNRKNYREEKCKLFV